MAEKLDSFNNSQDIPKSELKERNEAQLSLMEFMGATDTESRLVCIDENSEAFKELFKDPEVRQLIRAGGMEEVKRRLELLKEELAGKR